MSDQQRLHAAQRAIIDAATLAKSWPNGLAEMMRAKLDSIERTPEDDARLSAMVGEAMR